MGGANCALGGAIGTAGGPGGASTGGAAVGRGGMGPKIGPPGDIPGGALGDVTGPRGLDCADSGGGATGGGALAAGGVTPERLGPRRIGGALAAPIGGAISGGGAPGPPRGASGGMPGAPSADDKGGGPSGAAGRAAPMGGRPTGAPMRGGPAFSGGGAPPTMGGEALPCRSLPQPRQNRISGGFSLPQRGQLTFTPLPIRLHSCVEPAAAHRRWLRRQCHADQERSHGDPGDVQTTPRSPLRVRVAVGEPPGPLMSSLRRGLRALPFVLAVTGCSASPAPALQEPPRAPSVTAPDAGEPADVPPISADVVPEPAAPDARTPEDVPSVADAALATAPAAAAPATAEAPRMFRGRSEDEWVRLMHERPVVRTVARFHSTLYVFHMDLGDGVEISFQPEQRNLETFWRREVASYHLARLLGIQNRVPPTIGKRVPLSAFGRLGRGTNLVVDREGMVYGSASVWMPVLHGAQMHEAPARQEWSSWMNPANPLPPGRGERARQVSEVLVFDYLAANYDRWNCCNITVDENNDLVFRDNDAGWFPRVINGLGSPSVVRRVPRYLYESMQRATPAALRASIARDPMSSRMRLIPDESYVGYDRRRNAALGSLRRMVQRHGEAAVFPWP